MEPELTKEDESTMRALGVSREKFVAQRQREIAQREQREKGRAADGDGVTPEDLAAIATLGVDEKKFWEERQRERQQRS